MRVRPQCGTVRPQCGTVVQNAHTVESPKAMCREVDALVLNSDLSLEAKSRSGLAGSWVRDAGAMAGKSAIPAAFWA